LNGCRHLDEKDTTSLANALHCFERGKASKPIEIRSMQNAQSLSSGVGLGSRPVRSRVGMFRSVDANHDLSRGLGSASAHIHSSGRLRQFLTLSCDGLREQGP
jgi:hypothetical protein